MVVPAKSLFGAMHFEEHAEDRSKDLQGGVSSLGRSFASGASGAFLDIGVRCKKMTQTRGVWSRGCRTRVV